VLDLDFESVDVLDVVVDVFGVELVFFEELGV
jgi:hypothetical protein